MSSSIIDSYKETAIENNYDPDSFEYVEKSDFIPNASPLDGLKVGNEVKRIKVIHKKNGKKREYQDMPPEAGWQQFDKDLKNGYFS